MKVLLVEDDHAVRQVCEEVIRHAGHDLVSVADFDTAATFLKQHGGIDALLADVRLPGSGSGIDLAAIAAHVGIPALLTTGHHESIVVLEGRGIAHLRKPFRLDRVLGWLDRVNRSRTTPLRSQGDIAYR